MSENFNRIQDVCSCKTAEGDHMPSLDPADGYCLHRENTKSEIRYVCAEDICPLMKWDGGESGDPVMVMIKKDSLNELQDFASNVIHPKTQYNTDYEKYLKQIIAEQRDLGTEIFNVIADILRGDRK